MTNDSITLKSLVEKASDTDFLCEMIGFAADRLMALEVEALTGAGYGERSARQQPQWLPDQGHNHLSQPFVYGRLVVVLPCAGFLMG